MTHYELFFFYVAGFKPKDVTTLLGYNPSTAYRAYRNFRKAQKRAYSIINHKNSLPFKREKEVNTPDH